MARAQLVGGRSLIKGNVREEKDLNKDVLKEDKVSTFLEGDGGES